MKTPEEFIKEYYQLPQSKIEKVRLKSLIKCIERYKEYYDSELKKLNIPVVMPSLPTSLKTLFSFIDDGCVEIFFYGNDGFDRQEKVKGKELMKKYILDAWNEGNEV